MTSPADHAALALSLQADLGRDRREELSALLRQSCHDLNNPLGTMGLELFSLEETLEVVSASLAPHVRGAVATELGELSTILKNLTQAQSQLEDNVEVLHTFARALG